VSLSHGPGFAVQGFFDSVDPLFLVELFSFAFFASPEAAVDAPPPESVEPEDASDEEPEDSDREDPPPDDFLPRLSVL